MKALVLVELYTDEEKKADKAKCSLPFYEYIEEGYDLKIIKQTANRKWRHVVKIIPLGIK